MAQTETITCRICFIELNEATGFHFLNNDNNLMLQTKLLDFLPQLDLTITIDPVVCNDCTAAINQIHEFKQLCIRNEGILKNQNPFRPSTTEEVEIKEEIIEGTIKNEEVEFLLVDSKKEFVSEPGLYYCYHCHYATNNKKNLINHISTHRLKCNLHTPDNLSLTSHEETHFNLKCNMEMSPLVEHTLAKDKIEIQADLFQCYDCGYQTNTKSSLKCHMRIHHKSRNTNEIIKCEQLREEDLNSVPIQTEEKPFKCHLCDFRSKYAICLKSHVLAHTGDLPFKCKKCDYKTAWKTTLNRHETIHVEGKPFKCNLCDYCSKSEIALTSHMHKHSGDWPFQCDKCDYKTHSKYILNKHKKVHEKPFKCSLCNYRSSQTYTLKTHMYKHSGKWPFQCDECGYKTHAKYRLIHHLTVHSGEKPFKCKLCDFSCALNKYLRQHEKRHFSISD